MDSNSWFLISVFYASDLFRPVEPGETVPAKDGQFSETANEPVQSLNAQSFPS